MKLYTKIIILVICVALSIGGLSSIIAGRIMHNLMLKEVKERALVIAQSLSTRLIKDVMRKRIIPTRELLINAIHRNKEMEYAYIIDFDGYLFTHSFEKGFPRVLADYLKDHNHNYGFDYVHGHDHEREYTHNHFHPYSDKNIIWYKTRDKYLIDLAYPFIRDLPAHIHIGINETYIHEYAASLRNKILMLTLLSIILCIIIAVFFSRQITRPFISLVRSMHAFGIGTKQDEIKIHSTTIEVNELIQSFNSMINERDKLQEQLISSEKMAVVGQLSAGVAHEFNNILAIIWGNAQLAQMENSVKNIKNLIKIIETASKRGKNIVKDLAIFSGPKELKLQSGDITKVFDEIIKLEKNQLRLNNIKIKKEYLSHSNILFDFGQMEQVFLNLMINAIHAIKHGKKGTITIAVKNIKKYVQIKFTDTGIGMDSETRKKIFNPFFSTKSAYAKDNMQIKGSGLGLSICYTIIQQHKGTIKVESVKGKGTTFIIALPAYVKLL